MVDVIEMLVPAALHFGQEGPSSHGVAGIHICVKVAAQTADDLGLVEKTLHRYTRKKQRSHHHYMDLFKNPGTESLMVLDTHSGLL